MSLLAVFNQVKAQGLSWQETHYRAELEQRRAAADLPVARQARLSTSATLETARVFDMAGVPRAFGVALVAIRLAQTLLLLLIAFHFYTLLGIAPPLALLGLMAVAWAMTHGHATGTLAIEAYTAHLIAIGAAVTLLRGWWGRFLALLAVALLEGGLALAMPALVWLAWTLATPALRRPAPAGAWLAVAVRVVMVVWCLGALAVAARAMREGYVPGRFVENLTSRDVWVRLGSTFGVLPLLAVAGHTAFSKSTFTAFGFIVSAWVVLSLFLANFEEARHLLPPLVMVIVPGALFAVQATQPTMPAAPAREPGE